MKISVNINDTVKVKLTEGGKRLHRAMFDQFHAMYPQLKHEYIAPKEDAEGYSEFQLWCLMQDFGPHIRLGGMPPFSDIVIPIK